MLQVYGQIWNIFLLVLGVSFDLDLIAINKNPKISQVLWKNSLELFPGNQDWALSLIFLLTLLPTKVDVVMHEKSCKENVVGPLGSGGGKLILTLLAKIIIFHVRLTMIYIWCWNLERFLTEFGRRGSSSL